MNWRLIFTLIILALTAALLAWEILQIPGTASP